MSRLSLSDVAQMLIEQAEQDRKERERDRAERAETNAALRELAAAVIESRRPQASESVELDRAGTSGNPTVVKVVAVVQEGETLQETGKRAGDEFERRCARSPLPSGYAHAAPLGDEENPRTPPTLVENLKGSVKE